MSLVSCVRRVVSAASRANHNRRAHGAAMLSLAALFVLSVLPAWAGAPLAAHFSSAQTTVADATTNGLSSPEGVAVDNSGNVYIVDAGNIRVLKETLSGGAYTQSTVADATTNDLNSPEGVAVDGSGNVYIADLHGFRVLKETLSDGSYTQSVVAGDLGNPAGVAVDSNGNVYIAESYSGDVLKETPSGSNTYSQSVVVSGLSGPSGVAVDGSGNVYIADDGHDRVLEETPNGSGGYGQTIIATAATNGLNFPTGVAVDSSGNIYIADLDNNRVLEEKYSSGGYTQSVVANGRYPYGVAVDASGGIYVSLSGPNSVIKLQPGAVNFGSEAVGSTSTAIPLTFTFDSGGTIGAPVALTGGAPNLDFAVATGGTCTSGAAFTTGQTCTVNVTFTPKYAGARNGAVELTDSSGNVIATAYVYGVGAGPQVAFNQTTATAIGGQFSDPQADAVDDSGNVYVADFTQSTVQEIPHGCASSSCFKPLGGGLAGPSGVAVDGAGNVYVADANHDAVKEIPVSCIDGANNSSCVRTLGGGFFSPVEVAVDGNGDVYVADLDHNAVKEIPVSCIDGANNSSCVRTLGGGFRFPTGVAVDGSGDVYVANYTSNTVQEIPASCIAGANDSSCVETLGGGFNEPMNIAVDAAGDVYVPNNGASTLQEIPAGCKTSSCVLTQDLNLNQLDGVALDGSGNLYFVSSSQVWEMPRATAPFLGFPTPTTVGTLDSEGTQTAYVQNIGNQNLTFTVPETGENPSYPANFPENSTEASLCASGTPLAAGATCNVAFQFQPTAAGINSGDVVLTDNNLNVTAATQQISTFGTGLGVGDKTGMGISLSGQILTSGMKQTATADVWDVTDDTKVPVGTVTFTDTVGTTMTTIGSEAVGPNGQTSITWTPTGAGQHTVTSIFTPTDTSKFQKSSDETGATFTLKLADALKLTGIPATEQAGSNFTVTVTGYAGTNIATSYTGPVTITSTDPRLYVSNPITLTDGTATINVTLGTVGEQTLTVTDSADSLTATSAQINVTAGSAAYVRLVSGSGQKAAIGSAFAAPLMAKVYDRYGNPVSGAQVDFTAPSSGASAVLSATSPMSGSDGTVSVTATANGTASSTPYDVMAKLNNPPPPMVGVAKGPVAMNLPPSATYALTNTQAQTTLAVTPSSAALVYGQPVTLTAAIKPASAGGSDPTGAITFYDGSSELTSATVAGAAADYKVAIPSVGTHDYSATYGGDTNFAASTQTAASPAVVVNKAKVTLTGPTAQPVFVVNGQSGSIPISVTGQYSGDGIMAPSGSISYTISNSLGTGTEPITNGAVTIPVASDLPAGTYTVTITYEGDANYNSASIAIALQIGKMTPVVTFTQPGAIAYGTALGSILNASAASGSTSLSADGTIAYTATPAGGSWTAVSGGTVLGAGSYTLTATWTPNSSEAGTYNSASKSVMLTVNKAALAVAANSATRVYGAANPTFTGAVTGAVNGDTFMESFATSASTSSNAGTYSIVPSASGTDLGDYAVTTADGTLTVKQAPSAVVLTSSAADANLNAGVTLTATVSSTTSGTPTGSVQFLDGATVLGTSPLNNQGVATYTVSTLTAGTHLITAVYNGDTNFLESTSAQFVETVTSPDYSLTANPSSLTLKAGQTGKVAFTFAPIGGFTGTVKFACAGLPASVSCSFAPPSLTADGSNKTQTSELTITTEGSNTGTVAMNQPPGSSGGGTMSASLFFLPALLFGGFLMLERKKLNRGMKAMLMLLIVASGMTGMTGCGFRAPAVMPGTSVVTVTATATASASGTATGSGAEQHTASFTLTITQ